MSSYEQSEKECPLCMEPLEIDDIDFYPCKCEYQICRFCWHRLRTDENGLCPACRQPYPENPVSFKPLSAADVQKIKSEKKQKQQQLRIKICQGNTSFPTARIADPDILKKPEFFGKYGRILKECMYLHDVADNEVSFTKDDMHLGRHAEYERKLIETALFKDKAQRERVFLIANNRSKSGEWAALAHNASTAGVPQKGDDKIVSSSSRQADRSESRPRIDTLSSREKNEQTIHEAERSGELNSKHAKSTVASDDNSKPVMIKYEKREAKCESPDSVNVCEQALLSQENCASIHQRSQPQNIENNAHNSTPLRPEHARRFLFSS